MHKKKRNNNNKKKIKKKLFIHPVLSSLVYIPVSYIYWPKCPTPRPSTHTHTHPSKEDTKCHSNSNQKKITFFLLRTLERFCFSLLPKFFLFEFLAKILKKFSFPFFFLAFHLLANCFLIFCVIMVSCIRRKLNTLFF